MLHVITKNTKDSPTLTGKFSHLQILLIERVLLLTERDYTHWKGLVVLTCGNNVARRLSQLACPNPSWSRLGLVTSMSMKYSAL